MMRPTELIALNEVSSLRDYDPSLDWIAPVVAGGSLILFLVCWIPCVIKVWTTEEVMSGMMRGWGGLIVWGLIMDLSGPALWWLTGKSQVLYYFPQAPNFMGALIAGWLSAGILAILVWGVKRSWVRIRKWVQRARKSTDQM